MTHAARILVVEDEPALSAHLCQLLAKLGHTVLASAATGPDAVTLVKERAPDLVLLDVQLAGADTAARIAQHCASRVLFVTASTDDDALLRATAEHAAGYLIKPIDEQSLRDALAQVLERGTMALALRERELANRKLLARLHAVVDPLNVGVLVEDERRVVQHANLAFCRMFGDLSPAQLVGSAGSACIRNFCSLFEVPERFVSRSEELVTGQLEVENEVLRLTDGRAFERDYRPILLEGESAGHVWTYRDVSRRERDRAQLLNKAARLESATVTDELTGLVNRRGFRIEGERILSEARRTRQSAVVAFVDIDGLKTINDRLGHAQGDQAIRAAAEVLRRAFPAPDLVARLGGDEFAVLRVTTEAVSASGVQNQVYGATQRYNSDAPFELRMSVGAAVSDPRQAELGMLMAAADAAMYVQKQDRRSSRPPGELSGTREA